jgi:hypothetical protein
MAALIASEALVPKSVNSGMSTNWIPIVGRGCTPGSFGFADWIAARVGFANALATLR